MRRFLVVALVVGYVFLFGLPKLPTNPLDRLEAHALVVAPWEANGYADPHTRFLALNHDELVSRLLLAMERLDLHFDNTGRHKLSPGAVGELWRDERAIVLSPSFSYDARTEVLAHEIAHSLEPPLVEFTHGEQETFAMGVSYLLVSRIYCDEACEMRYASYLAMHKTSLDVLHVYRTEIEFAADMIWGER